MSKGSSQGGGQSIPTGSGRSKFGLGLFGQHKRSEGTELIFNDLDLLFAAEIGTNIERPDPVRLLGYGAVVTLPRPSSPANPASGPEWLRLPAPGKRRPHSGLSRSTLNELSIPGPANEHRPPVKSVVLRKRGALRGIRLISYDSLMQYLASQSAVARRREKSEVEPS